MDLELGVRRGPKQVGETIAALVRTKNPAVQVLTEC